VLEDALLGFVGAFSAVAQAAKPGEKPVAIKPGAIKKGIIP
jgi:hypothetical protein